MSGITTEYTFKTAIVKSLIEDGELDGLTEVEINYYSPKENQK